MTRRALVTFPDQVQVERPLFLKADWYPLDVVTIVAGRGGEGKSSLVLADVAAGTRGDLVGDVTGRARTLITAPEDAKGLQKARLIAAGARNENWAFLDVNREDEDGELFDSTPVLPHDLHIIGDALYEFGANLWVIDPVTSVIPGDLNKRDVVRAGLDPLTKLARDLHIAVVTIAHFSKGQGNASDKLSGSAAFRDVARSVLLVAHDKSSDERVITVDKSNYSEAAGKSWSFRLDSAEVADEAGETMSVPRAVVVGETQTSVEQIINRAPEGADGDEDRNAAQEFIIDYLEGAGGEATARDVIKAGYAAGFSEKDLKNAKQRLKSPRVRSRKAGVKAGWVWAIEVDGREGLTKDSKDSCSGDVSSSSPSVSPSVSEPSQPHLHLVADNPPTPPPEHTWTDPEWGEVRLVAGKPFVMDRDMFSRWRQAGQPPIPVPGRSA